MYRVIGVMLKDSRRVYYFDPNNLSLEIDVPVIVETEKGTQYGIVVSQMKKIKEEDIVLPLKKVLRIVTEKDEFQYQKNVTDSIQALIDAKRFVDELKLDMHMIDANFTFDRNQLLFHFFADERVDFRELAKRLAQIYRTRIELRQIGVRDKAKTIGGLGPCGRFLCCNLFLTDFNSVSINMAKNQYISLNPTKINGVCGRLLCCLNYEDDMYTELKRGLPEVGNLISTPEGMGKVISVDVFRRTCKVEIKNKTVIDVDIDRDKNGSFA